MFVRKWVRMYVCFYIPIKADVKIFYGRLLWLSRVYELVQLQKPSRENIHIWFCCFLCSFLSVSLWAYIFTYTYMDLRLWVYMFLEVCVIICLWLCVCECVCVHVSVYICLYVCAYVCSYACTLVYTCKSRCEDFLWTAFVSETITYARFSHKSRPEKIFTSGFCWSIGLLKE